MYCETAAEQMLTLDFTLSLYIQTHQTPKHEGVEVRVEFIG